MSEVLLELQYLGLALGNFTRLEVFGDARVHAVQVNVDTDTVGVFSFQPLMVA